MNLPVLPARVLLASAFLTALSGCAVGGVNLGLSLPVGRSGGIGVNVGSDGRVGASVGIGVGGGSVSVGTSGQLPAPTHPKPQQKTKDR